MAGPLRNTTMRVNIEVNSRQLNDADRQIGAAVQSAQRLERSASQSGRAIEQTGSRYASASRSIENNANALLDNANRARDADRQHSNLSASARRSGQSFNDQRRAIVNSTRSMGQFQSAAERLDSTLKAIGVGYFANKVFDIGKAAVATGMEFDKQMSAVQGISGATADQFKKMRDQAISLGASTTKSASEVAQGQLEMAKSGFTVNQTMAAMPGVISASTASGEDMARTAEVMTSALNSFQMKASAAGHVSDVLAQAANDSAADINDLGYAFKYAAPVANSLGVSLEELSASTEIMANAGIKGEQAGTTLRGGLIQLLKPSESTSKMMEKLGINVEDSKGHFIGLAGLIGNMSTALQGQTKAQKLANLSAMVGTDAASGFLTLMQAGPATINKYTDSLKKSDGASAKAAKTMQNNFAGAMEQLKGTIESIAINVSDVLTPSLRSAANWLSNVGQKFNELSPTGKQIAVWGSIVVAGIIPTIYVIKKTTETVGWLKDALTGSHDSFSSYRREMDETSASASRMASSIQQANQAAGEAQGSSTTTSTESSLSTSSQESRASRNGRGGIFSRFRRSRNTSASETAVEAETRVTRSAGRSGLFSRLRNGISRSSGVIEQASQYGEQASQISGTLAKFAKFAPILSGGLSLTSLIGINGNNAGNKIGTAGGSFAGGAAGAAIGSFIAPGIGTVIGGAIGSYAGSAFGAKFGEYVQKKSNINQKIMNQFADPLSGKVDFGKSINKSASQAINSYVQLESKSKEQLSLLAMNGDKYSKSARDAVNRNFSSMPALVEKSLSKTQKSTQKDLSTLVKNGLMSDKDMKTIEKKQAASQKAKLKAVEDSSKKMIQINNEGYKKEQSITSRSEAQINAIKSKAAKQGRILTQSEQNQIKSIESKAATDRKRIAQQTQSAISKEEAKQRKNVVASLSASAKQQKLILGKLRDDSSTISAKQAADIVKQSKKARDGAVKEANTKYKQVVSAADQEYYVNGTITKKQHDDIIAKAKGQRDGAIKQATDMNNKVVEQAKKQAKGHLSQIDWETGNTLSKWDNTKVGLSKTWNSITGGINTVLKFLHIPTIPEWHPAGSTGKNLPTHAAGTPYHAGGPAVVGEEGVELAYIPYQGARLLGKSGAEIVNLPRGARIMPHAQTKQMLSGGLKGQMPGYAAGTFGAIKDFASAAWDKTKDAASSVAGWIAHPVAKTESLFNKYLPLKDDIGSGLGTSILKYVGTGVQKYLKEQFSSFGGNSNGGAAAPAQVKQWLLTAMGITGTPAKYLGALTKIAMHESGGNPKAINLWDSNAKAGHPSKGLMQTIDSTFNAYKLSGLGDIYNPIANAVSAIRYMNARYGSISNVPGVKSAGYVGYKYGGRKFGNDPVLVGESGPEIVDPPDGSQIHNNQKTQSLLKGKGNIRINFAPVIQIKIESKANDTTEAKIKRAINDATEEMFKNLIALFETGVVM